MSLFTTRTRLQLRCASALLLAALLTGDVTLAQNELLQQPDPPAPPSPLQAEPDEPILLNFQDATIDAVLEHLSQVAGLIVIKPAEVTGRVTIISKRALTVEESVQVLNTVLKEKGFAAIRQGRTLKVVPLADAAKSSVPVHVGNDPTEIAATDEVITQVVPLSSVEAPQLLRDLRPMLSDTAVMTANASSNTVVITDTSANVRRLVQVINAMDQSITGSAEVKVFALQYARATDAARLINEVFAGRSSGRGGDSRSREEQIRSFFQGRGRDGDNNRDEAGQGRRAVANLTASADERTNTVVVSGPPEMIDIIGEVLTDLDSNPVAAQGVFVYAVKNGDAANLQDVLNTLFGTGGSTSGRSRTGSGVDARGGSQFRTSGGSTGPALEPGGMRGQTFEPGGPGGFPRIGGVTGPGGAVIVGPGGRPAILDPRAAALSAQSQQAVGDLYGQVFIVADEDTNALLVMTAPGHFEEVKRIISELDTPVPQVLIKVLIAEVTHSDELDLGVEFSILNAPNASSLMTSFGVGAATGGIVYKLLEEDVTATLRALEEVGKLEVLSRPYILASDNQAAMITVGSEVPFITSTQFTELGGTRSTTRYEDVGIILNVTPHISPDEKVVLEVAPEISALSGETVQVSENVFLPIIEKRSAETRVAINDGQTIVIGGLMEDRKTADIDKVPLLGDIPVLGHLFQRQRNRKSKTELLIFLTPHIAESPDALPEMSDDELEGTQLVPNAVEPGEYQRHIRGLKRGDGKEYPEIPLDADLKNPTMDPNEIDVDLPGESSPPRPPQDRDLRGPAPPPPPREDDGQAP